MTHDDNETRSRGTGAAGSNADSLNEWAVPGVDRADALDAPDAREDVASLVAPGQGEQEEGAGHRDEQAARSYSDGANGACVRGGRGVEFMPADDAGRNAERRTGGSGERFNVRAEPIGDLQPGEVGSNVGDHAESLRRGASVDGVVGDHITDSNARVEGGPSGESTVGAQGADRGDGVDGAVETGGLRERPHDPAVPMSDRDLLQALQNIGARRRALEAEAAVLAREFAARSSADAGQESLARRAGFSNVTVATAYLTSSTHTTAKHLLAVGGAVAPGTSLIGEVMPPRYPVVKAAVDHAGIATESAALIVEFLDAVDPRVEAEDLSLAESSLVRLAPSLTVPELRKAIRNVAEVIDPDGVEPSAEERHRKRSLRFRELPDGMMELRGVLDIATAMPIKVAVDAITTHWLRDSRGFNRPDDAATGVVRDETNTIVEGESSPVDVERRTTGQMNADALKMIAEHAIGCKEVPDAATTVIVRMNYDDLVTEVDARTGAITAAEAAFASAVDGAEGNGVAGDRGAGIDVSGSRRVAEIDGVSGVISAGEARRLAASAGIIPAVFGGNSEILDLGRRQRLATPAQRLALAERDGGCAFCGLDPSMCEAHHVAWWQRDDGPTDLSNLILLCSACHHRIHAEEWTVRIVPDGYGAGANASACGDGRADLDGLGTTGDPVSSEQGIALPTADSLLMQPRRPLRFAATDEVWFIPPTALFPERTPRLGGRKRFQPRLEPATES